MKTTSLCLTRKSSWWMMSPPSWWCADAGTQEHLPFMVEKTNRSVRCVRRTHDAGRGTQDTGRSTQGLQVCFISSIPTLHCPCNHTHLPLANWSIFKIQKYISKTCHSAWRPHQDIHSSSTTTCMYSIICCHLTYYFAFITSHDNLHEW